MKFFIKILLTLSFSFGVTLQEVYDNAEPAFGYDKYIVLEPNSIYTGGVGLYEGDVYINCQGSIIDLEEGNGVWVYADEEYPASLDIEYCTITNGLYYGISFGGNSHGNVKNCNLVSTNFGLKLFDYTNVTISNSIFAYNQTYGIGMYTEHPTLESYDRKMGRGKRLVPPFIINRHQSFKGGMGEEFHDRYSLFWICFNCFLITKRD